MRYNLTKHKILKVLADKLTSGMSDDGKAEGVIVVPKKEIINLIGKNKKLYAVIISELSACNEIKYLESSDSFIIETNIGLSAYSNKKYLDKNWGIILGWLKNFAQIFIPIVSLFIAAMALWIKIEMQNDMQNNKIQEIESRIESIEKLEYKKQESTKNDGIDTLNLR
ncbi:hypothetical protein QYR09_15085 [Cellulophaga lytica]|nr:hypothetical protein QYR09_15085 [Cellulophaga lytica]